MPRVGLIVCIARRFSRARCLRGDLDALAARRPGLLPSPPSCSRWSSPTSASRPTCSPRARSSRAASPGASQGSVRASPPTSSLRSRPHPDALVRRRRADVVPPAEPQRLVRAGRHSRRTPPVRRRSGPAGRCRRSRSAEKPKATAAVAAARQGEAPQPKPTPTKPKPRSRRRPQACVHGRRRARRAARRDHAGARAKQLAAWVETHPKRTPRQRRPLALPAQLDRLRREVRLVARRRGPADARSRSTSASSRSGGSAATASSVARDALADVEARSQ